MASNPAWLPGLVEFGAAGNDWARYCDLLYGEFHRDFIGSRPEFQGKRVGVSRARTVKGKEAAFWHCISEGDSEDDRLPDMRRCECIRWPRQLIEAVGSERVCWWRERQGGSRRAYVALPDFSYLVVLQELSSHCVLVTAYPVEREHSRTKLRDRRGRATEKG